VQEEHKNSGPWSYIQPRIDIITEELKLPNIQYIGRKPAAASAVCTSANHNEEFEIFMREAFD